MAQHDELIKQITELTAGETYARASRVSSRALWVTLFGCGVAIYALTNFGAQSPTVAAVSVAAVALMVSVYAHGKLYETAVSKQAATTEGTDAA